MMSSPLNAIKKLRRPPNAHNWVRNISPRTDAMAQSLFNTAVYGPRHSLKPVLDIIKQVVVDDISDDQAIKCASFIKDNLTRGYAYQILYAILPYIRFKSWKGVEIFRDMVEYYPVAAEVNVPVKPTFVINDGSKITPYFVICWTSTSLTNYQKRILTKLIEEAVLSLEDFDGSDAVIVCVPRYSFSKTERYVVEWFISDYQPLSEQEKSDLFTRYGNALIEAERMILEQLG